MDDDAPDVVTYGTRDDVVEFAYAIAERRGLDLDWVRAALAQARFIPAVTRYIMPSANGAAKNWAAYRARFVEPIRIRAGTAFWRANDRWLAQAEEIYGVAPEIVVGIVGVESIYGRQMGDFRVIDALATLAFDFPSGRKDRSAFFKDELESWFVLCKSERIDPLAWRGSYAGALGMAQFMPSSFNRYAVDFDGDGHVDLRASGADVIGSVANYLAEFGWKRGLPARFDVVPPADTSARAAAARARHRADLHRRRDGRARRAPAAMPRSPSTACSRSSSCRTATRRRATSPARATSTPSPATTGRATTRWRCSRSARRCGKPFAERAENSSTHSRTRSSPDHSSRTSSPRCRSQLESNQPGPPELVRAPLGVRAGEATATASMSAGERCGMAGSGSRRRVSGPRWRRPSAGSTSPVPRRCAPPSRDPARWLKVRRGQRPTACGPGRV